MYKKLLFYYSSNYCFDIRFQHSLGQKNSCNFLIVVVFFSEIWKPKSNQTSRLYIFKNQIKPNQIGNRLNQSGRFGQGILPVPQAKCLGHFACGTGEMALNIPRGHFATPTGEMAPKKSDQSNRTINWELFLNQTTKNGIFLKSTIKMEFWKFWTTIW